jgi:hypothetical protein
VRHSDEVRMETVDFAVDQHERSFLLLDVAKAVSIPLRRRNYEYVDVPGEELIDSLLLDFRIVLRTRKHQAVSFRAKHSRDRLRDLTEERMDQIRYHQTNGVRPSGRKRARREIRTIIQFLDALKDPPACLDTDVRVSPNGFRGR